MYFMNLLKNLENEILAGVFHHEPGSQDYSSSSLERQLVVLWAIYCNQSQADRMADCMDMDSRNTGVRETKSTVKISTCMLYNIVHVYNYGRCV